MDFDGANDVIIDQGMLSNAFYSGFGDREELDYTKHKPGMFMPERSIDLYNRDHVVMGIKVADAYRDRIIPKDANLERIFKPVHKVTVSCFDIYPGSADIEKYQEILQLKASGDVIIDVHQCTPNAKGYSVLVVYDEATMVFRNESDRDIYPKIK